MKASKRDKSASPSKSPSKSGMKVFMAYLESVSGKLSSYIVEVQNDKLLIKSRNTQKLKMEFDMQTIAPFSGSEKVMMTDDNNIAPEESTMEESKMVSA